MLFIDFEWSEELMARLPRQLNRSSSMDEAERQLLCFSLDLEFKGKEEIFVILSE